MQEEPHQMTNDHALTDVPDIGDENTLIESVIGQLHQLTERVAVLEAAQTNRHTTSGTTTARPPAQVRQSDPHANRQSGWQPTRR